MQSTVVQLGGVLVLAGLFVLLRQFMLRRAYFSTWTTAWIALAAALAAVVLRFTLLPAWSGQAREGAIAVKTAYYMYQFAKLAMLVWLVDGTRTYVSGRRNFAASGVVWLSVAAYATVSVLISSSQAWVVVWQTPAAVVAFAYCAWQLLSLPATRRTPGTLGSGTAFAYLAALWLVYAVVFGVRVLAAGPEPAAVGTVITINPYLDLLGSIMLGYGMILILMEDAKREVDDAQAALRAAHDHLRRAALYDTLTGAMNRSAFTEGLGLDMARASFGTVVLLDMDNLKTVNDEFGHAGGDALLRQCAEALRAGLRPTDRLYRWGGDEFLLVLPSARAADVQGRLERVILEAPPFSLDGGITTVRLAASIGAADYASYDDLRSAIDRADSLMYRQKHMRKGMTPARGIMSPAVHRADPVAG